MTTPPDITVDPFYERDLLQMSVATNYLAWQFELIRPFIAGHVLEVGAGIGNFTPRLAEMAQHVTALEPNRYCFERLSSATQGLRNVTRHEMTVESYHRQAAAGRSADTIVFINVMEHIEDDAAVLREFRSIVSPRGRLVIQVPAMPAVYGEIDRRLGHYRRYTKRGISRLFDGTGWRATHLRYFNSIGLLGWLWNTRVFVKTEQSDRQIWLFDKVLVPVMSRIERVIPPLFGQCLLAVAAPR